MATLKERATEAIRACGINCSFADADRWLSKAYGKTHGVTDATFYNVRSDLRKKGEGGGVSKNGTGRVSEVVTPTGEKPDEVEITAQSEVVAPEQHVPVPVSAEDKSTQTVVEPEVTFAELRTVAQFCKVNGGLKRVRRVMRCLGDLLD